MFCARRARVKRKRDHNNAPRDCFVFNISDICSFLLYDLSCWIWRRQGPVSFSWQWWTVQRGLRRPGSKKKKTVLTRSAVILSAFGKHVNKGMDKKRNKSKKKETRRKLKRKEKKKTKKERRRITGNENNNWRKKRDE